MEQQAHPFIRSLVVKFGSLGTSAIITIFSAIAAVAITLGFHFLIDDESPVTWRLVVIPAVAALIIAPAASLYALQLLKELIDSEASKLKALAELEDSLKTVKQLSGLLPICAYCKEIRDEEGEWQQLETYVTNRSEATFTHGMCPKCQEREFQQLRNSPK